MFRLAPVRPPAFAARGMVATSQVSATLAGVRMLERGGNAVDAAIAAAAVLGVTEPMSTGIGGDAFAIVHRGGEIVGLDAAGPAPAHVAQPETVEAEGPRSVNVPGAVSGWRALSERFGRLGLDTCLQPAIDVAERGFAIGRHTARYWSEAQARAPVAGELRTDPDQATTLRAIAQSGPPAIYEGPIAAKIAGASWLSESDLAAYAPAWVQPMHKSYGSLDVHELPPPSQGVAALEALAILEQLGVDTLTDQVQAVSLALEDAYAEVRDGRDVAHLLEPEYVRARAAATAAPAGELGGGTVYLCAVDEERMAVSFIQSLYQSFGSGVLVPGTGIYLNNRAACFAVHGRVEPGRRPFHTLMPGLLTDPDGSLIGPFGVMGGFIQAQAHAQFVIAAQRADLDPQAALDHPRFRVDGRAVQLEPPLWDEAQKLEGRGFKAIRSRDVSLFGGGQAVFVRGGALLGGSDARKDGCAAGI